MLGTLGGKTEFLDLRFNPQTYPLKNVSPALTVLEHISSSILNPFNVTQHASLPSKTLNLTNTVLRLASYSSSTFGAHTDTTFLTIVPYSRPGLQVYTESGWFKTPQNCIVIMSGELLEYTSGIESCLHRVVSEGERLSTVYLVRQKDGGKFGGVDLNEIWAEFNPGMGGSNDDERGREENVDVNIDVILPDYEDKIYYELFGGKVLNSKPDLINFKGLLNKNECSEIRELIDTNLDNLDSRSTIVGGNQKEINDIRTSKTFWLKHNQTTTLDKLSQYISKIVGIPLSNAEKFQVARYDEGGEYGVHMDHVEEFNGLECGGRVCSFIVYLNDDFSGGSTNFPEINVSVEPVEGLGLYFRNVREPVTSTNKFNLKPDFDAIHKGSVVSNGKKYILTLWFHPVNL